MDKPFYDLTKAAYHYLDRTHPDVIRLVETLLNQGLTPRQVQQYAEARIGPCETSHFAFLVAEHLQRPPNYDPHKI